MNHLRRAVLALFALAAGAARAQRAAPRWFTITVRQDRPPPDRVNTPTRHGAVVVDSRSGAAPARSEGSRVMQTAPSVQNVRVQEGGRTLIQFETAVPMTFRRFSLGTNRVDEVRGTVTYDALVQFVVRPRVTGGTVTLDLEPQDGSVLTDSSERGRLSKTVQGRLGEWIAVGDADLRDQDAAPHASLAGTARARTLPQTDQRGVWLKVELEAAGRR